MYCSTTHNSTHIFCSPHTIEYSTSGNHIRIVADEGSFKLEIQYVDEVEFLNEFGNETNITDIQRLIKMNDSVELHIRQYQGTDYESFEVNAELTIEANKVE